MEHKILYIESFIFLSENKIEYVIYPNSSYFEVSLDDDLKSCFIKFSDIEKQLIDSMFDHLPNDLINYLKKYIKLKVFI